MTKSEKILLFAGLLTAVGFAAKKVVKHFTENILVSFNTIDKFSINLVTSKIKLSLLVTNKNDFPLYIGSFRGTMKYGTVIIDIDRDIQTEIPAGNSAALSFNVSFDNENFLYQIADLIKEGGKPLLEISGFLEAGLDPEGLFELPISQKVVIA